MTYRATADELRQFIERIERQELEKQDIAEGIKEIYAEAKSTGYDTAILRKIISMRKKDAGTLAEEQAVMDMYLEALGM